MNRLTAMTMGAAMIGFCGFVYDSASAQTPAACPSHEATVYFGQESAELDSNQNYAVVTMAEAARSCGAKGVVVQAVGNGERANAVATALKQRGIKTTVVTLPALALAGDTMIARAVTLRVADGLKASS
jgi:hypothetical protein